MAMTPLNPAISPRIELCRKPKVYLIRDEDWTCQTCGEHYGIDEEGKERQCVSCMFKKGQQSIMLFGWQVIKTVHQLIAMPPAHRVDSD